MIVTAPLQPAIAPEQPAPQAPAADAAAPLAPAVQYLTAEELRPLWLFSIAAVLACLLIRRG